VKPHVAWPHAHLSTPAFRVEPAAAPSGTTLHIGGELDILTIPQLSAALEHHTATATDDAPLRLDLSGVEFMSATPVGLLLATLENEGTRVQVMATSPAVRRVLWLLGESGAFGANTIA
jgi:anti-anti-sigma factor